MQNDDNGMTGQQEGATAAPATGGKGFGKGLLNLAKASAKEAGRGAKLAALKTQMEKLKRMDLVNALGTLGAKAHETKALAETFGPQYAEIDGLDESIKTKRAGVEAKDDDGFAGKAKAKAISVKMGAEAQALEHKRKNKCVEIGRAIVDGGSGVDGLAAEIQVVAEVQSRIEELEKQLAAVSEDRTGRDALASSARSLGADAKAASKSPIWRKPLGKIIMGFTALTLLICVGAYFTASKHNKRTSLEISEGKTSGDAAGDTKGVQRWCTIDDVREFLIGYCDAWIRLSDNPPKEETLRDPVSLYLTKYLTYGDVPSYGINDYEVLTVEEYNDAEQRSKGYEQAFRFTIRVVLRSNSGGSIGTKKLSGRLIYDADNYSSALFI